MCSVSVLISAFNAAVEDFFQDLLLVFPGQAQINGIFDLHCVGARANIRLPVAKFHEMVMVRYGDKLREFDVAERFFMEHRYEEVNNKTIVDILKSLWSVMTEDNKDHVYEHLSLIISIYDKVRCADPAFLP